MSPNEFTLVPFPALPFPKGIRISGKADRVGAILHLNWKLEDPSNSILMPATAARPERRRELWEATCFEFFLSSPEHPGYWEFNLSPAGHWNVFHFDSYRKGMKDELAFDALPFTVSKRSGIWEVSASIDTTVLGIANSDWQLAISTVLAESEGRVTFWALSHPGIQPDFHHPDAFWVQLKP